jgi:hypothetical protein
MKAADSVGEGKQAPAKATAGKPGTPGGRSGWSHAPFPVGSRRREATPGRRIAARAARAAGKGDPWVYVDTWYTMGPFPNPNRRNIDTPFVDPNAPVDLDAVYRGRGKDGRDLKWQFVKSPAVPVCPADDEPYGIYYAYTELWFEKAMDLEIAVGSDDNSRLWINGHQVWVSARHLKPWRASEGYRVVHFREGLNRVLYRVENGWGATAFSFMICVRALE